MKNKATMVVDATNLYKVVFDGVKSYALQKQNIHAIWGFLKKLRGLIAENQKNPEHPCYINKVICFWDGAQSGILRENIFPQYKDKRKRFFQGIDPYYQQIDVLKEMLCALGITNFSDPQVETDDCIAEYCRQNSNNEHIFICSNDHDYFQLVSNNIYVYYLNRMEVRGKLYPQNVLINSQNFEYYFDYNPKNILLRKIILGDESDSIPGANGFGEKSIVNEIPMFQKKVYDKESLLEYAVEQLGKKVKSKRLEVLIEFLKSDNFEQYEKLINLKNDMFVTDECRNKISDIKRTVYDKGAFLELAKNGIAVQIKTDSDYNGEIRTFLEPFFNVK